MPFYCRIDGQSPTYMDYKFESSISKDDKKSNDDRPGALRQDYHQTTIDSIRDVSKIDIYTSQSVKADDMHRVVINLAGFDPIVLGTIDCTQKSVKSVVPPFFKQCKKGMGATLVVYQVKAPLAYETAGREFERFQEALVDEWRAQVMSLVKQGMKTNDLDENQKISPLHFQKALGFLHDQCKGKKLGIQFDEAFKKLKL